MADNRQMMVFDDGPIEVNGPLTLVDENGKTIAKVDTGETVYLCRCGASIDKPFCDGTHSKIGFQGAMKAVRESGK
jgi:CDGSH-type Zn-finger protein